MPRYFFDINEGDEIRDYVSKELPGEDAARHEGYGIAAKVASDPMSLLMGGAIMVTVRDSPSSIATVIRMVCQDGLAIIG
ncbi:DUF6894 family protein [Methylobacterium brachythecii]|uniref:DUF6894 domain-containing protein n=1 Tax=Methylobacterium brachythecii TaxID=1176177 RepID=A0A7W6AKD1_9HYPH|nr:hypothetical protein [Methylobacterium brachythecii]MBB3902774.1 hypothetical protein [Methylobacterium brachythecii]GLS46978.1 hypothetical protein GCM10007884_49780 [Methylobacterium brachythecii]